MKRLISMILTWMLFASFAALPSAAQDQVLTSSDVTAVQDVTVSDGVIKNFKEGGYVGFSVDMTGVRSIALTAEVTIVGWTNGEAFRVRLDDPKQGDMLGYLLVNRDGEGAIYQSVETFGLNLKTAYTGVHTLYLVQNYNVLGYVDIQKLTLSTSPFPEDVVTPVPDSVLVDDFSDTWAATDALGRRVADYAEAGDVKDGLHQVGIFYWGSLQSDKYAIVAKDAIAEFPASQYDFHHSVWSTPGKSGTGIYWSEPMFGFYGNADYFVYRRHAEMLSNAGVDAIFFDCTNGDHCYVEGIKRCFNAFHDARAAGVNTPKISFYMPMGSASKERWRMIKAMYLNFYQNGEFADLWYTFEGKPFVISTELDTQTAGAYDKTDSEEAALYREIIDFFNFRHSSAAPSASRKNWHWRSSYPQPAFNTLSDGRPEFTNLAVAINESYEYGASGTGAFSDPYTKGRAYTEAFGEDYRDIATEEGYFMKEQISRVLELDPGFVFITGWNEWHTARSETMNDMTNVFIDLYDDENSRDIEPSRGMLKDTFYNLLVDFVRKYKGVRPAPVSSGAKTIDIHGDIAQWDSVSPAYINTQGGYTRDIQENIDRHTGQWYRYTSRFNNLIRSSKVSFDENMLYFLSQTAAPICDGEACMTLYLNTDRNYATGWEGYDFVIGLDGAGVICAFTGSSFERIPCGTAEVALQGDTYQLALSRALLNLTGSLNFELKWVDGVDPAGDILRFYTDGSACPAGRFNYVFTETAERAVPLGKREALSGLSLLSAGKDTMMVSGAKMKVYEKDIRVVPFEANGTLYLPAKSLEDILGYGQTKVEWGNVEADMLIVKNHDLLNDEITDYRWIYTTENSLDVHINGRAGVLSHPILAVDGLPFVPASLLSDCFGYTVRQYDGLWALGRYGVSDAAVDAARSYLN